MLNLKIGGPNDPTKAQSNIDHKITTEGRRENGFPQQKLGTNQRIPARRFIILNALGALLWAVLISAGGYFFGAALDAGLKNIRHYELEVILGVMFIGVALWIIRRIREKRTKCG